MSLDAAAVALYRLLTWSAYEAGELRLSEVGERFDILEALVSDSSAGGDAFGADQGAGREELDDGSAGAVGSGHCGRVGRSDDDLPPVEFLVGGRKWVFTLGDPDPFPSIPHGHVTRKTNPWPKLDPFRGRCFLGPDQEDRGRRLSKDELRKLWNDGAFRDEALKQVDWWLENRPRWLWRVRDPRRLPRP